MLSSSPRRRGSIAFWLLLALDPDTPLSSRGAAAATQSVNTNKEYMKLAFACNDKGKNKTSRRPKSGGQFYVFLKYTKTTQHYENTTKKWGILCRIQTVVCIQLT